MSKIGIFCIILVATVPFLIIGIAGLLRERSIKSRWPVIQGVVVELLRYGWRAVKPVVEYQVGGSGEKLRVKNFIASNLYSLAPGQIIDIYYNPEKPEQYRIAGDKVPLLLWGLFSVLGAFGVVVGFVAYAVL